MSYGKRLNKNLDWRKECMQKREKERKVSNIVWRVEHLRRLDDSARAGLVRSHLRQARLRTVTRCTNRRLQRRLWGLGFVRRITSWWDSWLHSGIWWRRRRERKLRCCRLRRRKLRRRCWQGRLWWHRCSRGGRDGRSRDSHRRGRRCSHTDLSTISTNLAGRRPDDARAGLN